MMAKPDWRELLMGTVEAELASRDAPKRPHRDYRARVPLSAAPHIAEAARRRDMSITAYLRRAAIAFAAYDLGLDQQQMLVDEPATRLKSEGPRTNRLQQGRGHGDWKILGLE